MTTAVREKPILMSRDMVHAIIDGRKTMARIPLKPQPPEYWSPIGCGRYSPTVIGHDGEGQPGPEIFGVYDEEWGIACPFGSVGDLLRVREKWRCHLGDIDDPLTMNYAADDSVREINPDSVLWEPYESLLDWKWKPSIHMPRWATRLWLTITNVHVERLQSISESDAAAEGVDAIPSAPAAMTHRTAFAGLWDKFAKPGSQWKDNPWCWCISFQVVTT